MTNSNERFTNGGWFDLTRPITHGMPVYPGDPPVVCRTVRDFDRDPYQLTELSFGCHTGTHLDLPRHYIRSGAAIEQICLESFLLPGLVACLPFDESTGLDLHDVDWPKFPEGGALILSTGWEDFFDTEKYHGSQPFFAPHSSEILIEKGVGLIGLDVPTVQEWVPGQSTPDEAGMHIRLLSHHILILEGLCRLKPLVGQRIELIALPLLIPSCEASPVRAIARIRPDGSQSELLQL